MQNSIVTPSPIVRFQPINAVDYSHFNAIKKQMTKNPKKIMRKSLREAVGAIVEKKEK